MANILVLGVKVPFTKGGAEILVSNLVEQLKIAGHNVDLVELPFSGYKEESWLAQAALWRSLDLSVFGGEKVDLLIGTKFPSYYVSTKNSNLKKSLWLVHQHRQLYDLYGGNFSGMNDQPRIEAMRRSLVETDTKAINECDYISAISHNVAERLESYNQIKAEVLYPPLPLGNAYVANASIERRAPYILSVGRLCSIKRVDLMFKAIAQLPPPLRIKVVGAPDEKGIMEYYKREIDALQIWDRVDFMGRVDQKTLIKLFSECLAVYYAPYNEDYGYVTLEGFASSRPVITALDSGGVLEFVKHEKNGLIAQPNAESMAEMFNRLATDHNFADKLGANGREMVDKLGLAQNASWSKLIAALLSPLKTHAENKAKNV